MSQENVEIVRAAFKAWNARDMSALRELYDPAIVVRYAEDWPEGSEPTMGREAVIRQWEQRRAPFDSDTLEPIEFIDAGDRVVVRQIWRAVGRGPDLNIEVSTVTTLRKGKTILLEFFGTTLKPSKPLACRSKTLIGEPPLADCRKKGDGPSAARAKADPIQRVEPTTAGRAPKTLAA
jgi:ketosteroid isomerase-like protein